MAERVFIIRDLAIMQRVLDFIQALDVRAAAWLVTIELFADPKSREQEKKYHAMIGDIAAQFPTWQGIKVDAEDWKRLLVDIFCKQMAILGTPVKQAGRIVPSLDGGGIVQLGVQTRRFTREEGSHFIEFLYMYGAEQGVELD